METPPASIRALAHRLLAVEAANSQTPHSHVNDAVRVCDKLRVSLIRFAGTDGFVALMRRAVALARADVPSLCRVQVRTDGSLEGLEELAADASSNESEAAAAVITHLLGLLVTLLGEPVTVRLLRDAWPEVALEG